MESDDNAPSSPAAEYLRRRDPRWKPPPDEFAQENEADPDGFAHEADSGPFYVSRFPVTVGQFAVFYSACGLNREGLREYSLKWPRNGPSSRTRNGLLHPMSVQGAPTRPVRHVMYRDALAYASFLTDALRDEARAGRASWARAESGARLARLLTQVDPRFGHRWCLTLPSEAEWEKSCRGPGGWEATPWRGELDPTRANYQWDDQIEHGAGAPVGGTSPVGAFVAGRSIIGAEELLGNLAEFSRTGWLGTGYTGRRATLTPQEWATHKHFRPLVRGGSFEDNRPRVLRTAHLSLGGESRASLHGFRLVAAPVAFDPQVSLSTNWRHCTRGL